MTDELAILSPAELDVLRLLAAGHTIKSIAASLGRSEGSINERLREARRKTGATSSRELARRVAARAPIAAQENRDRFIDLAAASAGDAPADAPGGPVRRWRLGGMIMVGGLILAGALALNAMQETTRAPSLSIRNSPELTQYLTDSDAKTQAQERQFQAQLGTSDTDQTSVRISNDVKNLMRKNAVNGKVDVACGAAMCRAFTKLTFSKAQGDAGKAMVDLQDIYMKFGSSSYLRMANHSISYAADGIQLHQNNDGSQDVLLLSYWRKT